MSHFSIAAIALAMATISGSSTAMAQQVEQRIIVAPTNPASVGVGVVVMGRRCATCGWRPMPGVAVELRGPSRVDSSVVVTARATSGENGVAHVVFEVSSDSLLYSPGPITASADGGPEVDVSDRFQVAVGPARRIAGEQESAPPTAPSAWAGELASIRIAGRTRRQVARTCAAAGLRWERRARGDYQCTSTEAPVPRHILGHRGASIVFTFDGGGRVESAALNLPFGNTGDAQRAASRLLLDTQRRLGPSADSGGDGLGGRSVWRVRGPGGRSWDLVVGHHGGNAMMGYTRVDRAESVEPAENREAAR